jgi:hypothetical protein
VAIGVPATKHSGGMTGGNAAVPAMYGIQAVGDQSSPGQRGGCLLWTSAPAAK